jgi:hypothetical protein
MPSLVNDVVVIAVDAAIRALYAKAKVSAGKSSKDRIVITPVYVWHSWADALQLTSEIALALKEAE